MNYELTFQDEEFGTITEYYGALTKEILFKCTKERYSSKNRNENYKYIINDYTNVTSIEISSDAVKIVAQMAIDVSKYNKNIVIAGVTPSDLEFGLARMWQAYADETGWKSHVFRSRAEAEEWVKKELQQELKFNN